MIRRLDEDGEEIDSELMAYFGDCKAHSVGTDRVKAYVAKRLKQGAANATINRELAALESACTTLGFSQKRFTESPTFPC